MKIIKTKIEGCYTIEPRVFEDERGSFFESFNLDLFSDKIGYKVNFVQDNQSFSTFGVMRGLHFQKGIHSQAKLVRVLSGKVLDIAVDIRKGSPTYGEHIAVILSSENKKQFFMPKGFAHGFIVLSDTAEFFYKVDNFYAPQSESGVLYNDPNLGIDWILDKSQIVVNNKDMELPLLNADTFL